MRLTPAALAAIAISAAAACAGAGDPEDDNLCDDAKCDSPDSADNPLVPSGDPTRLPIVLIHGFNASPAKNGFGPEVVQALCDDGHAVFAPETPAFASVEDRADALAAVVQGALDGGVDACGRTPSEPPAQVNLIAHSMGGLDSRYLISGLGYGDRVATLTTLSTPHRGSAMADMALGLLSSFDDEALAALAAFLSRPLTDAAGNIPSDLLAAMTALAESTAPSFNTTIVDDDRVHYQSWAGLSNVAGILNPQDAGACEGKLSLFPSVTSRHVMHIEIKAIAFVVAHEFLLVPNDGLVQVASAKWGTFRGCMPADHIDEVGASPIHRWDHVRFLRNRAFELAAVGY